MSFRGWFASVAVSVVVIAGCSKAVVPTMPEQPPPVVRVVEVALADVVDYEYFTGRIDAKEALELLETA